MSHKPPVPKGAVAPYPLQATQRADRDEARQGLAHELAETAAAHAKPETGHRGLRFAAGAAIGSAAIAAALIFYNRSREG